MKELLNKQEIQNLYSVTSDLPEPLEVDRVPKNFFEKIKLRLGLVSKTRTLLIYPITLGARERYSIYAEELEVDKLQEKVDLRRLHNIVAGQKMASLTKCIATVINNSKEEPPRWLIKTIERFTDDKMAECIAIFRKQIDVESFLNSIISLTGMSLKPEEIIAPEKEKKTHGDRG